MKQLKCMKCGEIKPIEEFGSNKSSSTGYQSYCRLCKNANHAKNQANNMQMRLRHHFYTRMASTLRRVPDDLYPNLEEYLGYRLKDLVKALDRDVRAEFGFNLRKAVNVYGFHIDHRKPLSSFEAPYVESVEFKECWAISNLKAIPADENLSKGSRILGPIEPILP